MNPNKPSKTSREISLLALGDSYTIGESVKESACWPNQLKAVLEKKGFHVSPPEIIAKTGWTTGDLISALQQQSLHENYDYVGVLIGVNNQYQGRSYEEFRTEFTSLLETAIRYAGNRTERVFVLSIPDWGVSPFAKDRDSARISNEIASFNQIKKKETTKRNSTFVDITSISRKAAANKNYIAKDGLHYSGAMYQLWVEEIVNRKFLLKTDCMEDNYVKACELDKMDPLGHFKDRFVNDENMIYLDGNSLGKLPKKTIESTSHIIEEQWGNRLIRSWNENWIDLPAKIAKKIAKIVGAREDEIFVGDTTSFNLYKLVFAALQAQKNRHKIISDTLNFPSDLYVVQGLISSHFKDHSLQLLKSENEISVDESTVKKAIDQDTALVTLSHVTYKSSFMYNMKTINELAHKKGSYVIWDLSHAVGVVPIQLNNTNADMAVGCTYKYLNGGPGSPAFLYVKKELQEQLTNPVWSWFSHENPFDFDSIYTPGNSIQKFAVSTPSIVSLAAIEPGLDILLEAGIEPVRDKSILQSEFLSGLVQEILVPLGFHIASPKNKTQRGSHITIQHKEGYRINRAMIEPESNAKIIIPDFRPPNNIRLGIAPLYNSYVELYETVKRIRAIVIEKEYEHYPTKKLTVP